jgi:hypothetical protein
MTRERQPGKSPPAGFWPVLALLPALFAGLPAPGRAFAGDAGPVVEVNAHTGLAISGFDPVAYFTNKTAKIGRPDLELSLAGAVWRFRNEGNRAAFAEHPEVYAPQFGGYDPVAIARGISVPGHPLFWSVAGERLYLFYSAEARAAFLSDPGRIIETATRKWPAVARTVSP